ncbi:MAG: toprim domain-containing protein [Thermomicrobiales bacterium]
MPNSQLEIAGAELVRRLGGHWAGDRGMCLCPAHDDHTPSLSVRVGNQSLLFKCFAGCETIDVLRALRRLRLDVPHDPSRPIMVPDPRAPNPMRAAARELWDAARPITGGPADRYLQSRHLAARPAALRFHPRTPLGRGQAARYRPAIIAAIIERKSLVSVQRFFLERDGSALARDLEKPKRTLAGPLGGAVQLFAPGPVLGLAEGVETAMSATQLLNIPVWAALGSERLHRILIPDGVRRLVLLPDNDRAGRIAVGRCQDAYADAVFELDLLWPWHQQNDWNQILARPEFRKGRGQVRE